MMHTAIPRSTSPRKQVWAHRRAVRAGRELQLGGNCAQGASASTFGQSAGCLSLEEAAAAGHGWGVAESAVADTAAAASTALLLLLAREAVRASSRATTLMHLTRDRRSAGDLRSVCLLSRHYFYSSIGTTGKYAQRKHIRSRTCVEKARRCT